MDTPLTIDNLMAAISAPARSRTERYMARVEDHLKTLTDDAQRVSFLRGQLERWMELYSAWALRIDSGAASDTDLGQTAFDYTETLGALSRKLKDFAAAQQAASA